MVAVLTDLPQFVTWRLPPSPPAGQFHWGRWSTIAWWGRDRCAICGVHGKTVLDHDHGTDRVRGWLCMGCNAREGWGGGPVFDLWRAGVNPYAIFGWEYAYNSGVPTHHLRWVEDYSERCMWETLRWQERQLIAQGLVSDG